MIKAVIPLPIMPSQHRISRSLCNSLQQFHGFPGLRVFKGNLTVLESTKMPPFLTELQAHSMKIFAYG